MPQEFLASAFDAARGSMEEFIRFTEEELPALPFFSPASSVEKAFGTTGTFSIDLDFSRAGISTDQVRYIVQA